MKCFHHNRCRSYQNRKLQSNEFLKISLTPEPFVFFFEVVFEYIKFNKWSFKRNPTTNLISVKTPIFYNITILTWLGQRTEQRFSWPPSSFLYLLVRSKSNDSIISFVKTLLAILKTWWPPLPIFPFYGFYVYFRKGKIA